MMTHQQTTTNSESSQGSAYKHVNDNQICSACLTCTVHRWVECPRKRICELKIAQKFRNRSLHNYNKTHRRGESGSFCDKQTVACYAARSQTNEKPSSTLLHQGTLVETILDETTTQQPVNSSDDEPQQQKQCSLPKLQRRHRLRRHVRWPGRRILVDASRHRGLREASYARFTRTDSHSMEQRKVRTESLSCSSPNSSGKILGFETTKQTSADCAATQNQQDRRSL